MLPSLSHHVARVRRGMSDRRSALGTVACLLALTHIGTPVAGQTSARPPTLDPTYGLPLPATPRKPPPAPKADWIWAATTRDRQTVLLRRAFDLRQRPRSVVVYITADNFFALYVNGHLAARTSPELADGYVWKHVQRADITPLIGAGRNQIAVAAVNEEGPAGLVAVVDVDGKPTLITDSRWKVHDNPVASGNWTAAPFDDSTWTTATVEAPVDGGIWQGQLDGWPGYEADAPYLAHVRLYASAVLQEHAGAGAIEDSAGLTSARSGAFNVRLAPAGSTDPPSLVLDFGKELAGRLLLRSSAPIVVLVGTGESLDEAVNAPWGGVHRLEVAPGRTYATPYSAFRYALLTMVGPPGAAPAASLTRVYAAFDHKYYPVEYRGSFACSDPVLTRIWYTGAYTAHLCMQEDIWDAPKRDRARWMGDLHVSGEVINTVFADRFLMEQTMQRLRDDAQGGLPPALLPKSHVNGIPGYSCAWICGLADFYRHAGDMQYLRKQHDLLTSMLAYLRTDLDDRGVFTHRRGEWPFVDWSPDFSDDGPLARAATHMFLVKAVKDAAFLFEEMGDTANAHYCAAWADDLSAAARKYLVDPDTGTYSDRRQENAMAICAGVPTPEQTSVIYDAILKPGSPAWEQVATPYYNYYVIDAMSICGHTADVLPILREYWGGMLDEGATTFWEGYDPSWEKDHFHAHLQADNGTGYFVSLCHGWSSGPTAWLTERVLGIRPTGGGFRTVEIDPELGDLSWASGVVPTPHGALHVSVSSRNGRTNLTITLPPAVTATASVPGDTLTVNGKATQPLRAEAGRVYVRFAHAGVYALVGE